MLYLENVSTIRNNYEKYDKIYFPVHHVKQFSVLDTFKQKTYHLPQLAPDDRLLWQVCDWKARKKWGYDIYENAYAPAYLLCLQDVKCRMLMEEIAKESHKLTTCLVCYCDNVQLCHLKILANIIELYGGEVNMRGITDKKYAEMYQIYQDAFYCLVAGSREFNDKQLFYQCMDMALHGINNVILVSGGAKGADTLAEEYAEEKHIPIKVFPADWNRNGKSAGFIRNQQMHQYIGCPADRKRGCICFWDGQSKGTQHNFKLAYDYHTPIRIVNYVTKNISTNADYFSS